MASPLSSYCCIRLSGMSPDVPLIIYVWLSSPSHRRSATPTCPRDNGVRQSVIVLNFPHSLLEQARKNEKDEFQAFLRKDSCTFPFSLHRLVMYTRSSVFSTNYNPSLRFQENLNKPNKTNPLHHTSALFRSHFVPSSNPTTNREPTNIRAWFNLR
jgi:hypothetical protein